MRWELFRTFVVRKCEFPTHAISGKLRDAKRLLPIRTLCFIHLLQVRRPVALAAQLVVSGTSYGNKLTR